MSFLFADFSDNDDDGYVEQPYDEYLTVQAFLEMHFGEHTGRNVYNALLRMARKATTDVGGSPGLIFNDEGGEFVSFSEEPNDNFGLFAGDD
jgi:hypothetical protein